MAGASQNKRGSIRCSAQGTSTMETMTFNGVQIKGWRVVPNNRRKGDFGCRAAPLAALKADYSDRAFGRGFRIGRLLKPLAN